MTNEPNGFKGTGCIIALVILAAAVYIMGPDSLLTLFGQ